MDEFQHWFCKHTCSKFVFLILLRHRPSSVTLSEFSPKIDAEAYIHPPADSFLADLFKKDIETETLLKTISSFDFHYCPDVDILRLNDLNYYLQRLPQDVGHNCIICSYTQGRRLDLLSGYATNKITLGVSDVIFAERKHEPVIARFSQLWPGETKSLFR